MRMCWMRRLVSSKVPAEVRGGREVCGLEGAGLLRGVEVACSPGRRLALCIKLAALEETPWGESGEEEMDFSGIAVDWEGPFAVMVTGFVM